MKKFLAFLVAAAMVFAVACGNNDTTTDNNGGNDTEIGTGTGDNNDETGDNNYDNGDEVVDTGNGGDEVVTLPSPADTLATLFDYLIAGDFVAADAFFSSAPGEFSDEVTEMSTEIGVNIFQLLSFDDLVYVLDGHTATVTFTLTNFDFLTAMYEIGFELGYELGYELAFDFIFDLIEAGLLDPNDPDFDEIVEELIEELLEEILGEFTEEELGELFADVAFEILADMLDYGDAPTFSGVYTVIMQLVDDNWIIIEDLEFAFALLGMPSF